MAERSLLAYDNWKTSQEKFDYFILGVIGAFCAYLSQHIDPRPLGLNSSTLEVAALLIILAAGIAGFLRLQTAIELYGLNFHRLHLNEKKGELVSNLGESPLINRQTGEIFSASQVVVEVGAINEALPDIDVKMKRLAAKTSTYYKARNMFLLCGFFMIIVAKVWAAYEGA